MHHFLVFVIVICLALYGVHTHFLVVLLERGQILAGLREFTLLHTLANVPGKRTQSRTPINELDGALGLDSGDGSIDIFRHNISAVQHAASHVFSVTRVAFDHLVSRLEAGIGDLSDAGAGATTKRVEDEESLQASAHVGELADTVQHHIHDLLANGVVTASVVVGGIFLARDQLLRVEKLAVSSSTHLICTSGLEVDEDSSRYMFACARLTEECVEAVIAAANRLVGGHLTIGLDTVLQAVQLPACIADLYAGLANVDGDAFTLQHNRRKICERKVVGCCSRQCLATRHGSNGSVSERHSHSLLCCSAPAVGAAVRSCLEGGEP
ncbi:hypothetical protein B566_EDAN004432 [Ephemera danica]|nr:hypothetical protein B566_EDAN004432 [Ephemera danica]